MAKYRLFNVYAKYVYLYFSTNRTCRSKDVGMQLRCFYTSRLQLATFFRFLLSPRKSCNPPPIRFNYFTSRVHFNEMHTLLRDLMFNV